jgi:hypothetical protein
LARGIIELN